MLLNLLPVFLLAEVMAVVQAAPLGQEASTTSLFDRAGAGYQSWGGLAKRGAKFPEIGSAGELLYHRIRPVEMKVLGVEGRGKNEGGRC